jgi:uncharacterized protein YkwD
MTSEERRLLELTNTERAKEKLPPLAPNSVLFAVARKHSANMGSKDEMNHVLDGKTPAQRVHDAGFDYKIVAENIAEIAFGRPAEAQMPLSEATLKDIMGRWMASPAHRKNILGKSFDEIGLGVARTEKGKVYFTQVFGKQRRKLD